jgi:hypothetical protein
MHPENCETVPALKRAKKQDGIASSKIPRFVHNVLKRKFWRNSGNLARLPNKASQHKATT